MTLYQQFMQQRQEKTAIRAWRIAGISNLHL
jgi:hypothetical protein